MKVSTLIRKLLTYEEAKRAVEVNFKAAFLGEEEAVILEAYSRVLSADVESPIDIPGFASSKVNGYAVKAQDTANASEETAATLKVTGTVCAGETSKTVLMAGEAFEISAAAVLPEGAEAVVAAEDAERTDDELHVYTAVSAGENLNRQGADIQKGALVLPKGKVLGSSEIGVLAALGLKQVKVQKIPMIAVLSVGTEINELSKPLEPGKTYDLNSYAVSTAVMECGAKPVYFGVLSPESGGLKRVLKAALASTDMVIACGSEAAVVQAADALGGNVVVNGFFALKPGKGFSVAYVESKPVFCLPSNPSTCLLMYQLFARTLVQRLAGRSPSRLKAVSAFAGAKMFSAKGSRTFQLVRLEFDDRCRLIAQPVEACGAVSGLVAADGFVQIAENEQFLEVEQEVQVLLFRGLAAKT